MFQWMKNVHQYLNTKTTKQIRLVLLGTKQVGISTFLDTTCATSSDSSFCEFKISNFGCQTWLLSQQQQHQQQQESKEKEQEKQNLHAMIVLLDASEPNEWVLVYNRVKQQPSMPILFVLNKQDLCYRSTPPNKSAVIEAFDLYEHKHPIHVLLLSLKHTKENLFPALESFFRSFDT